MNREELYEFITPMKKRTWIGPLPTEENHKKFWIAACMLNIYSSDSYPKVASSVHQFIRICEFHSKNMWERGNQQALTYRSNRVDENIQQYLWKCRNAGCTQWAWEVRDPDSWNSVGYVKARTRVEAEQLAKLMYSAIVPNPSISSTADRPIWSDEKEEFTRAMNAKIIDLKKYISRKQDDMQILQEKIEKMETNIEFIMLNMTAFDET